ncbi:hypothetical protein QDX81_02990 [Pseudomonas sp. CW003PS]|jgi:hypothetical protein|nr:hypothetical protein QDX81_02990 [Pseudomonas sp. CW003PS]
MKKILAFAFATLAPLFSYAESSAVSQLKRSSAEAMSCTKGFAAASQILGQPQYKGPNNQMALSLVKVACTSDELVIAFYSAQRNSNEAKSLEEIRSYVQEMIGGWFSDNAAALLEAQPD